MDVNRRSVQNSCSAIDKPQEQKLKIHPNDDRLLNLRSRKSLTALVQSESTTSQEQVADEDVTMAVDFETTIKQNYLDKENLTTDTNSKDQEGEHDSVMTSSEDDEVEANSMDTQSEDDAFITHEEDEPKLVPVEIKMEVDECLTSTTTAATRGSSECSEHDVQKDLKQDFSDDNDNDNDSALGSLKSEEVVPNFEPGQLVWTRRANEQWWPCIVINQFNHKGREMVNARYFAYRGMRGTFVLKNVLPYCPREQLPIMTGKNFKSKQKLKPINENAMEEIKHFVKLPSNEDRIMFYSLMVDLQATKKSRKLDMDDVNDVMVTANYKQPLTELIQSLIEFEKLQQEIEVNKPPVIKREPKVSGFMDQMMQKIKVDFSRSGSVDSVKSSNRHSDRIVIKRRLSEMSCISIASDVELPPKPKKVKLEKEKIPFEQRFVFNPKHIKRLLEVDSTKCVECLVQLNDRTFQCTKCSNYVHERCGNRTGPRKIQIVHKTGDSELFGEVQEESNIHVICKSCVDDEKPCFICKKPLTEDPEKKPEEVKTEFVEAPLDIAEIETFKCLQPSCNLSYHTKCLRQCRQSKLFNSNHQFECPQHKCHSCTFNNVNKDGSLVKCLKCPSVYHGDIFCLPAGSQVIAKDKIICPRHTAKNDKMQPLNLNSCSACDLGGELICCDSCPKAYHAGCIPVGLSAEKAIFLCDDCEKGDIPTYNSCVWAKVGIYRWWPAYILTPIEAKSVIDGKHRRSERQFCVRFFGSYDHHWTSHERVIICSDDPSNTKLKNVKTVLDKGFGTAIDEMNKMLSNLQFERSKDKMIPKNYTSIKKNRYLLPAQAKKILDVEGNCKCLPTDESPCGPGTSCIMQTTNVECDKSCQAGEKCQNQSMRNRTYVKLKIFKTHGRGFGAKTTVDIKEGQLVMEYVGEIITKAEVSRRLAQKKIENNLDYYFCTIDSDLIIDAEPFGNYSRFINHSCDPNCYARKMIVDGIPRIGIYTLKDIAANTELSFDYQMKGAFRCHCGASNCGSLSSDSKDKKKKKKKLDSKKKLKKKRKPKKIEPSLKGITSPAVVEADDPLVEMMDVVRRASQ